jgi:DnaJ homolog subfamily C member 19
MGLAGIWLWRNTDVTPTVFLVGLAVSVMGWLAFLGARIAFRILWEMRMRVIWVSDLFVDRTVSAVMDPIDEFLLRMTGQPRPPKPEENKDEVIEARAVLGLPERFTKADVNARGRHLSKQTHPDQGGTNWLQARVNWAVGVLAKVAVE